MTTVRYALHETPLGACLIAATGRGLRALTLGDDGRALTEAFLLDEPDAAPGPSAWADPVLAYLDRLSPETAEPLSALPLDVPGTPFQHQVWAALREVAAGETVSYRALADRLGRPTGSRAVARACAQNAVALVVPCHRAVGSDGALHGYRWGVERKRLLLAAEGGLLL